MTAPENLQIGASTRLGTRRTAAPSLIASDVEAGTPVTSSEAQVQPSTRLGDHQVGDPVNTGWEAVGGSGAGGNESIVHTHSQAIPAAVWQIAHELGRRLTAWSLFDEDGTLCGEYRVENVSSDLARVVMDTPTAGTFRYI